MIDPYAELGISPDASDAEIKAAWRRLARAHHPDHHPDDPDAEEKFKKISAAYELISDPTRRAEFERAKQAPSFEDFSFSIKQFDTSFASMFVASCELLGASCLLAIDGFEAVYPVLERRLPRNRSAHIAVGRRDGRAQLLALVLDGDGQIIFCREGRGIEVLDLLDQELIQLGEKQLGLSNEDLSRAYLALVMSGGRRQGPMSSAVASGSLLHSMLAAYRLRLGRMVALWGVAIFVWAVFFFFLGLPGFALIFTMAALALMVAPAIFGAGLRKMAGAFGPSSS